MTSTYVAACPRTGIHLRAATSEEVAVYLAENPRRPFDRPVRVGEVTITEYTGPGASHIPGRFL